MAKQNMFNYLFHSICWFIKWMVINNSYFDLTSPSKPYIWFIVELSWLPDEYQKNWNRPKKYWVTWTWEIALWDRWLVRNTGVLLRSSSLRNVSESRNAEPMGKKALGIPLKTTVWYSSAYDSQVARIWNDCSPLAMKK